MSLNKTTRYIYFKKKEWLLIDADGVSLGRLASNISKFLIGKHKSIYTPNINCGDHVIVINAEKISLKGKNIKKRKYINYSGYPGKQKITLFKDKIIKNPISILEKTIKGMLPKTKLGKKNFKNLHLCLGSKHRYDAQKPKFLITF